MSHPGNGRLLIPRHERKILVDLVVKKMKANDPAKGFFGIFVQDPAAWIGIKRACSFSFGVLSDICPKAIALAESNSVKNQLQVECRVGDCCSLFE